MSRWLLLLSCLSVLSAVVYVGPSRAPDAQPLGGACESDRGCQLELECVHSSGLMEGQCTATCNAAAACQERFGHQSVCLGADLCARTCERSQDCPEHSHCNAFGWCER